MKVIIIGGVAAGMSAASKIKRINKDAEVTVYEKRGFLSYGACGLPYYVGNFNDDYKKLFAKSEESFNKAGITTKLYHEVISVDTEGKKVLIKNIKTSETFIDTYDKLMISTGASAIIPAIKGVEKIGIHTLKTFEDGIYLREISKTAAVKNVVIIGGGYIGVECADAFLNVSKNVTIIEASPNILASFDVEMYSLAVEELKNHSVLVKTSEKVIAFEGSEKVSKVITDKGEYPADLVIIAVGIKPETDFLKDTNITLAKNSAICVDREMRTSVKDVYAAGDCAMSYSFSKEENIYLALGTVANKCGRIAGNNICGFHEKFIGSLSSAAIKVCDLELGRTGLSEEEAKELKLNYKAITIDSYDRPAYYPEQTPIKIKLIYEIGTKRILGAQLCGKKGAALRTDIFATAIQGKLTTEELGMTDLIYAPPFASVWDAVQIACNVAK